MTRRYLLRSEVAAALRRGKVVECFLGRCERDGRIGVRHLALSSTDDVIVAQLFETADLGGPTFLDLYEFGPLNRALEHGEPDQSVSFSSLDECLAFIDKRWPASSDRLVNERVLQDEYADFVANRSN
jgi:hypothetical protein